MRFRQSVGQRGFTLTELMVALFAGMLLIAASYATFIAQNRSYIAQEGVSEVNTQSNIAFTMIANDIKMAGFGTSDSMDEHPVYDPVNNISYTSPLTPTDSTSGTDTLTIVAGFRLVGTLSTVGWSLAEDNVDSDGNEGSDGINDTVPFNLNTIRLYNEGGNLTLAANDAISIDGIQFTTVNSVTVVDSDEWDVGIDSPTASAYPMGRPVYLVEYVTYSVNANGDLLRTDTKNNPAVVAENVEDLQFGYAVDSDEDGALDDTDASGVFDQGDFVYAVADRSTIGAVRVNVLARTGQQDPNQQGQGNPPPQVENRAHSATNDGFKRRWWQSTVKVRND